MVNEGKEEHTRNGEAPAQDKLSQLMLVKASRLDLQDGSDGLAS